MKDTLTIDVVTQAAQWPEAPGEVDSAARRAAEAAWQRAGNGQGIAEICIVLSDNALVGRLNRDYRGQDKPTNVLSFPAGDDSGPDSAPRHLGDVVLAYETIAAEARQQRKTLADHVSHLCVHGLLHLLGHDHATDATADAMEALETDILASLGIADPFAPPTSAKRRSA